MALSSAGFLKPQTALQQLLEDINFQRTKEMRQMLKDDSGFVVVQGTTYWTDLFVRHFLFQNEPIHSIDSDDLLFFVRKKHVKTSSRHMPKFETEVEVFRKDSRKLPIGDPDVDWEETVYLNMVIHQFDYTLTLAICTRTSPKELQVLKRHSQRVYASPSRRKMDSKGENEEITYPHICFMVDNFDEVFSDILVRDGEMVCVELVANDKDGAVQGVIFLGSIRYDALKKVYDARQSSLSSKVAQRMSFGLFSSGANVQTRCEFVRMKGPQGKGHAEMAVTKPKGSGVETPTSEPGFCATDMWDDWEDENDDYCTYRHQRRLSDPSANLNNFTRYSWRTKNSADGSAGGAGAKARSENEGLDSLANDVSEIEAGDLRDDLRPAFSASETILHDNPNCSVSNTNNTRIDNCDNTTRKSSSSPSPPLITPITPLTPIKKVTTTNHDNDKHNNDDDNNIDEVDKLETNCNSQCQRSDLPISNVVEAFELKPLMNSTNSSSSNKANKNATGCTNCFGSVGVKKSKRWIKSDLDKNATEMSEVYCPTCDHAANATPACLETIPDPKDKLKPPSVLTIESEIVLTKKSRISLIERQSLNVKRSSSMSAADRKMKTKNDIGIHRKEKPKIKEKEKEKDKGKEKDKEKVKEKDKGKDKGKASNLENDKEKSVKTLKSGKTSSLLSKVSPKRLRSKLNDNSKQSKQVEKKKITVESSPVHAASAKSQEYEIADDATSLNGEDISNVSATIARMAIFTEDDTKTMINVRGKEELPAVSDTDCEIPKVVPPEKSPFHFEKNLLIATKTSSHPLEFQEPAKTEFNLTNEKTIGNVNEQLIDSISENHLHCTSIHDIFPPSPEILNGEKASSLSLNHPSKRSGNHQNLFNKAMKYVPKRRTPDGTNIYYWCDLPKRVLKELDDGAYNPLWASRGFTQSFHFWKENRRQQSTPLNAFLTYVTLPWWSIAKDLLDHRETPILTF